MPTGENHRCQIEEGGAVMREISAIGKKMLRFQERLAAERHYKPIEPDLFLGDVRQTYLQNLPEWCSLTGAPQTPLYTLDDTQICTGYDRIVIGDYGAFVEISPSQIIQEAIHCKPGQEFRRDDLRFSENVKYLWMTAKDRSNCKIYLQKKMVSYANYLPGMYYISPYEVYPDTLK